MVRLRSALFLQLLAVAGVSNLFAHSYGPAPKVTGAPGDNPLACTQCHTTAALNSGAGSVKIVLQGAAVYIPGVKQRVVVQVSDPTPTQQRWGFELTARLNSDPAKSGAGELTPVDGLTQVICEDAGAKPCLTGLSFIQHTSAGTRNGTKNGAAFQFDWTPPATNAGPLTLYVAGNAANGNGTSAGDNIYTASVQMTPVTPVAPVVSAGNIVSAATSTVVSVTGNTWMSLFGAGLSATTRSWTDGDFLNGAMPSSLDGVSVILTSNGAPRLATIGYVSPTQVNFLIPTDMANNTISVQVHNPAGLSALNTITTQAQAPQLLTLDGKRVWATHADGSLVTTAATATAGETLLVYSTGTGVTAPVQIPNLLPMVATPVATLPLLTIGGQAASVASATVIPGVPGVYQLTVKVPVGLTPGDQPVVLTLGAFNSVAAQLAVK